MGDPGFFKGDPKEIARARDRAEAIIDELLKVYQRWEELEDRKEV